jgi:hypothetical protein
MSDLQNKSAPDDLEHTELVPAEHHEQESRTMLVIAMAGIAALFLFSVAMAVTQISTGVKTAANGKLHAPISAPETTGSNGHRS